MAGSWSVSRERKEETVKAQAATQGGFEAACGEGVLSEGERWQGRENGGCVG